MLRAVGIALLVLVFTVAGVPAAAHPATDLYMAAKSCHLAGHLTDRDTMLQVHTKGKGDISGDSDADALCIITAEPSRLRME